MNRKITYRNIPIGQKAQVRTQIYTGNWSIFRPIVDKDVCTKCGICVIYCPEASIHMMEEGIAIDYNFCKGCGICANECPVNALSMEREEK